MTEKKIIEKLRKDEHYFGEFGKQWLSNSDITRLRRDPVLYGQPWETTPFFMQGQLLHQMVLEPNKKDHYHVLDCATRNNKEYRVWLEKNDNEPALLLKEKEEVMKLYEALKSKPDVLSSLRDLSDGHDIEEPGVTTIFGYPFKGKADRINHFEGITYDLKMTFDYQFAKSRFKQYGYHTQAYIYQKIFGYPVVFVFCSIKDNRIYKLQMSDGTLAEAEADIMQGLEVYERYYGDNPEEDINNFILTEVI